MKKKKRKTLQHNNNNDQIVVDDGKILNYSKKNIYIFWTTKIRCITFKQSICNLTVRVLMSCIVKRARMFSLIYRVVLFFLFHIKIIIWIEYQFFFIKIIVIVKTFYIDVFMNNLFSNCFSLISVFFRFILLWVCLNILWK